MIGLTTRLPDRAMPFRWQDGSIRLPTIGVADGALTINCWKRGPYLACRHCGSCPNCHTDYFSRVAVDCEPNPFLVLLLADKRPQFITFQNQAPLFCSVTITERGTAAYLVFT